MTTSSIVHFLLDSLKLYAVRREDGFLDLGEGMGTPDWPSQIQVAGHILVLSCVEEGENGEEWALYSVLN